MYEECVFFCLYAFQQNYNYEKVVQGSFNFNTLLGNVTVGNQCLIILRQTCIFDLAKKIVGLIKI